jgi:ABC-type proline/glycine betaine transport system substrate-binding protein
MVVNLRSDFMKKKILQCFMLVLVLLLIACSKEESEDTIEEVSEGISKATVINNVLEQIITSYKMKLE